METQKIKIIFAYFIKSKNKVIGKLENISIKESLKRIRPKLKRMKQNDEFVKPTNYDNFDIFDKDLEEEFSLEDIIIKENNVYKIYIKPANENKIIQNNNNSNFNNNDNIMNNMNNMTNINNNNNLNNNIVHKKFINNQMNDNFKIIYNVLFKTTNNIEYTLAVNGRKKMDKLIQAYVNKMSVYNEFEFFYRGKKIEIVPPVYNFFERKNENFSAFNYFRDDKNPVIIVKNDKKLIGKLIHVTYLMDKREKFLLIFNNNADIYCIRSEFCHEFGYYKDDPIEFFYNNHRIKFNLLSYKTTIGKFFKNNEKPELIVKIPYYFIIQVTFKTNHRYIQKKCFNSCFKIGDILSQYLEQICEIFIGIEDNKKFQIFPNKVQFLYKGQEIKFYDEDNSRNKKIYDIISGNYFKDDKNPTIFINDPYNILLINWFEKKHIIFQTNHGYKNEFFTNNTNLCSEIIEKYFRTIGHENIHNRNKIQFIYNGQEMEYESDTTVGQYFQQ